MEFEDQNGLIDDSAQASNPIIIGEALMDAAKWGDAQIQGYERVLGGSAVVSQLFRLFFSDPQVGPTPPSAIIKLPAADRDDREQKAVELGYIREAEALRLLAELQGGFQPIVYSYAVDRNRQTAALLMEDIGPQPSQQEWHREAIQGVMQRLGKLHSLYWEEDSLARAWWIRNCYRADIFNEDPTLFVPQWEAIAAKDSAHVYDTPNTMRCADYLADHIVDALNQLELRPRTLVHGDIHQANVLRRRTGSGLHNDDPVLVDWQDAVYGGATSDVAKFLSTVPDSELSSRHEAESLNAYYESLSSEIRASYPFTRFSTNYRLALLATLANYVIAADTDVAPGKNALPVNRSLQRVASFIELTDPLTNLI